MCTVPNRSFSFFLHLPSGSSPTVVPSVTGLPPPQGLRSPSPLPSVAPTSPGNPSTLETVHEKYPHVQNWGNYKSCWRLTAVSTWVNYLLLSFRVSHVLERIQCTDEQRPEGSSRTKVPGATGGLRPCLRGTGSRKESSSRYLFRASPDAQDTQNTQNTRSDSLAGTSITVETPV